MPISGELPRRGSGKQNLINQLFAPERAALPRPRLSNSGNYEVVIHLSPDLQTNRSLTAPDRKVLGENLKRCFCWITAIKRKSPWRRPWELRGAQNIMDPFFLPRRSVMPQQKKNLSSSVCWGNWTGRFLKILLCYSEVVKMSQWSVSLFRKSSSSIFVKCFLITCVWKIFDLFKGRKLFKFKLCK